MDLLDSNDFNDYLRSPRLLGERLEAYPEKTIVIIDEIQKLPQLLNEVQRLMKSKRWTFLLTGSSARKLKQPGINLLGGRAWSTYLFPLVSAEIDEFNLLRYLNRGGLPSIYDNDSYKKALKAYTQDYLKQEIIAEALVRQIQPFAKMLDIMGQSNGNILNYTNIARDCGVSDVTIKTYIDILEDTLLSFRLPAFNKTTKRRGTKKFKFYFFDVGVANSLSATFPEEEKSKSFGNAFEHFIILELRAFLSYNDDSRKISYWRLNEKYEVDCIIGDDIALEIKATPNISDKHLRGIRTFKKESICKRYIVVSLERDLRKTTDDIEIWPYDRFLKKMWLEGKL